MHALRTFKDVVVLILLWALACVALGVAARAMSWLFCLGFGC